MKPPPARTGLAGDLAVTRPVREPGHAASPESRAYRRDIDGLRAVAVLAVVAFHADAALLPGGFTGVDVFFVISGFLITGLIVRGLDTGSFRFADFYARRIRRLFPAYIAVSLATLAAASWLLVPYDYAVYTASLTASWAFLSNVFFSMTSWGYFGQRTAEFPLLHTWSLSVEEQFYFLFPLAMILLHRRFRKHMAAALALAAAGLVCYSQWKSGEVKSYFLLGSRAHELIIGSLAWFALRRHPPPAGPQSALLAAAGAALVLGSFVFIHKGSPFPGFMSLLPCAGTALLIYGCCRDNTVSALLKSRILVGLGLISYSLYLWHWPILAFLKYRQLPLDGVTGPLAVAVSIVLAYLTWRFIESPARRNAVTGFRPAFLRWYALPAGLFLGIGLYSHMTDGAPSRFPGGMRDLMSSYSFERDLARACSVRAEDYRPVTLDHLRRHCAFGAPGREPSVLLMGDSHAHHFKPFVDRLARHAGLGAVYHVQGGCFPTALQPAGGRTDGEAGVCRQRNADLLKLAGHFDYVVLSGFWASEPAEGLKRQMRAAVETIVRAGAVPVLIKDNPFHEPDLSRCVLYRARGWLDGAVNCHIPAAPALAAQAAYDAIVDRVQADFPTSRVIDPKRIMCDATECATHAGNIAFYKDANHLNAHASAMLGERYAERVGNPLAAAAASGD